MLQWNTKVLILSDPKGENEIKRKLNKNQTTQFFKIISIIIFYFLLQIWKVTNINKKSEKEIQIRKKI